jgi:hypothetical protein
MLPYSSTIPTTKTFTRRESCKTSGKSTQQEVAKARRTRQKTSNATTQTTQSHRQRHNIVHGRDPRGERQERRPWFGWNLQTWKHQQDWPKESGNKPPMQRRGMTQVAKVQNLQVRLSILEQRYWSAVRAKDVQASPNWGDGIGVATIYRLPSACRPLWHMAGSTGIAQRRLVTCAS